MGRLSKEQLEIRKRQEQKAAQNRTYNAKRYHVSANLPTEWREAIESIARDEGYVYNGSVTVGGYIKELIEADLRRRGMLQEEE